MQRARRSIQTWLRQVELGWGERAAATARSLVPLLTPLPAADFLAAGEAAAIHGHGLDDLIAWFDAMLEHDVVEVEIDRGGQRMVLSYVAVNVPQGAARQMMYGVLRRGYASH